MGQLDPLAMIAVVVALALGGVLKGATGAGAPLLAVPIMASFADIRLAVALMAIPNLVTNAWQVRSFFRHRLPGAFDLLFAAGGALGAVLGTLLLARLAGDALSLLVAAALVLYIVLRLTRPAVVLTPPVARWLAVPAGTVAGVLQGAAGLSAPVSITFLNAMKLDRATFIATISIFFLTMAVIQLPALLAVGLLTPHVALLGILALVPLIGAMPVGGWLAGRLSRRAFDRAILSILALLALKLLVTALRG